MVFEIQTINTGMFLKKNVKCQNVLRIFSSSGRKLTAGEEESKKERLITKNREGGPPSAPAEISLCAC